MVSLDIGIVDTIEAMAVSAKSLMVWLVLMGCQWLCAANRLPTRTWIFLQNWAGAFASVQWGSQVVSSPSFWKWSMNSLLGWQWWALAMPYNGSPEKNPGCGPFSSYCGFIPSWLQVPWAQRVQMKLSSPSVMGHH